MMLRMVAAGESTGRIDTMLEKMADFWDEEIEALLDSLTSLIEFLIMFLGVIVGGIVIAMFLPIFELNEVVSQSKSWGEASPHERGADLKIRPLYLSLLFVIVLVLGRKRMYHEHESLV